MTPTPSPPKVKPRSLLLWVRHGKVTAYRLSGVRRRVWRFRREDLDASLLSKPMVSCEPLVGRSDERSG
jgi:hypothetical protein